MSKLKIFVLTIFFFLFLSPAFSFTQEEDSFNMAARAFSEGFYEAGISLFKKFIEEFPASRRIHEARLYIAEGYYLEGNYLNALEILNEMVEDKEAGSLRDKVYYWLGEIHYKGLNFEGSLEFAQNVIDNHPDSRLYWRAHLLAANSCLKLGKEEEADAIFKKIIAESEEIEVVENGYSQMLDSYFQKKEYSEVFALGEKYLKQYPQGSLRVKIYFYFGESHYAGNKLNEAIFDYRQALTLSNDTYVSSLIHQSLGLALLAKGEKEEAKKNLDKIEDRELYHFSQGFYYFKVKDYPQSLEIFNNFLKEFPKSRLAIKVYLNKADTLYEMGRFNDALSVYRYILDNFNVGYENVADKVHYSLAWCYLKNGQLDKAAEEFKNTLKYTDNPTLKTNSQIQIADAYQQTENYAASLKIYQGILQDSSSLYIDYVELQIGIVFLKTERFQKAVSFLTKFKKKFPDSSFIPEAQYYLAVSYFSQGRYSKAERILENFIKEYAGNKLVSQATYFWGKCLLNQSDYTEAIEVFEELVKKSKGETFEEFILLDLGNCYLRLFLLDKARKTWKNFLSRFPQSSNIALVMLSLGEIYEKEGNYPEAEKYYHKVIVEHENSKWAINALFSLSQLYLNKGDLEEGENYLKNLEKSPLVFEAKLCLAKIYRRKGKESQALKVYDELINSDSPVVKDALLEKAFTLKEVKEYSRAALSFRRAIEAGKDSAEARFSLGWCLEKTGQNKEAIDEYFKIVDIFDEEDWKVKAYFRIARIYEDKKDREKAKEIYKKIINFDTEEAKIAQDRLKKLEGG